MILSLTVQNGKFSWIPLSDKCHRRIDTKEDQTTLATSLKCHGILLTYLFSFPYFKMTSYRLQ